MKRKNEHSVNNKVSWEKIITLCVCALVCAFLAWHQLSVKDYMNTKGIITTAEVIDYYGTRYSEGVVVEFTTRDGVVMQSRLVNTNLVGPLIKIVYDPLDPSFVQLPNSGFPVVPIVVAVIFGLIGIVGLSTRI